MTWEIMKSTLVPKSPYQPQSISPKEFDLKRSSDPPRSESSPSFWRKSKTPTMIVRRSQRIRSTAMNVETKHVVQEISIMRATN